MFSCQDIGTIFDWRSKFDLNSLLSNGSSENIQLELRPMENEYDDVVSDKRLMEEENIKGDGKPWLQFWPFNQVRVQALSQAIFRVRS